MRKLSLLIVLLLTPALAQAWPWSQDMANQISTKPQEGADPANPGMRPFPQRSVPAPGTIMIVKDKDAADKLKNPIALEDKSVATGGRLFEIYCVPCHGKEGKGDGYVGAKFVVTPADLSSQSTRDRSDGFIWGHITYGGVFMPSYANDLSPTERWHVINYVRKVVQHNKPSEAKTSAAN